MAVRSALVCPISRSQAVAGMPGIGLPAVARAVDLNSALAAVLDLNRALTDLAGQGPVTSGPTSPLRIDNTLTQDGGFLGTRAISNWQEQSRTTRVLRFFQGEDPDSPVWIDVERIEKIVWVDNKRNTSLRFEYGEGSLRYQDVTKEYKAWPRPLAR